jgi:hypothetical protein
VPTPALDSQNLLSFDLNFICLQPEEQSEKSNAEKPITGFIYKIEQNILEKNRFSGIFGIEFNIRINSEFNIFFNFSSIIILVKSIISISNSVFMTQHKK